jgi:hypothetical protein
MPSISFSYLRYYQGQKVRNGKFKNKRKKKNPTTREVTLRNLSRPKIKVEK